MARTLSADDRGERKRELIATILLSLTTVLSAWSAFQATRWHGKMSITHSDANTARAEYTVASEDADAALTIDLKLFTEWVDAHAAGNEELASAYAATFRNHFKPAFDAWLAQNPSGQMTTTKTPFDMEAYRIPQKEKANSLFEKVQALSERARDDVKNAYSYTLTTVMLASVLFFSGISMKLESARISWFILSLGGLLFAATGIFMLSLPVAD